MNKAPVNARDISTAINAPSTGGSLRRNIIGLIFTLKMIDWHFARVRGISKSIFISSECGSLRIKCSKRHGPWKFIIDKGIELYWNVISNCSFQSIILYE